MKEGRMDGWMKERDRKTEGEEKVGRLNRRKIFKRRENNKGR